MGRCVSPLSRSRTGPASPRRSACARGRSPYCTAGLDKEQTMNPFLSVLRSLVLSDSPKSFPRSRGRKTQRRVQPYLELLEDRLTPSAPTLTLSGPSHV